MKNDAIRLMIYLILGLTPILVVASVNLVVAPNECWAYALDNWGFWVAMVIWGCFSLWVAINWRAPCRE